MCPFIHIGKISIPTYGLCIASGLVAANIIGYFYIRKRKMEYMDFLILESYALLGGFIGAKALYLIVSFRDIAWEHIFEIPYLIRLMKSGFVFYGGLIGGLLFVFLAGKVHGIDCMRYISKILFLLPMVHGFGRIGCFLSGCCYGIPYDGIFCVSYPEGGAVPSGIPLFPVQPLEALLLFLISGLCCLVTEKFDCYEMETYLMSYSLVRFILEFFRYDEARGIYGIFSTSQWISIALFAAGVSLFVFRWVKRHPSAGEGAGR